MQTILVCDDDKEIVEAIDIYLQQEGYQVLKAYDGEEALEILKEKEDSAYDTGTEVNAQSQIVSLSTCTNVREDERFLLQGVLTATDGGEN